ncbi:MAG TPA: protein translocase subunit SecF [Candidatus Paceibacterota bacterium]|nr:protein translocase subunit SecF [Candidatus Paceibacterota bacterium]
MTIGKNLKYFFILPGALSLLAIIALIMWGLKPGIDLAGGSLLQVSYAGVMPTQEQVMDAAQPLNLGEVRVQPAGTDGYVLRQRALTNDEKNSLEAALGKLGAMHEDQFTSIGPSLGTELVHKAWIAITLVVICIIFFIAFAFRGVSKPVASWKYGIVAIITLLHDVLIPVGLFAALGHFAGAEVDSLFIVALLTILGISINDTIVVFDRIRENLRLNEEHHKREQFDEVVGRSILQTLARSINTSVTVVIVLAALYFLGPVSTRDFALTLIVGMIAGTYSSIFLASPLLVVWERFQKKS